MDDLKLYAKNVKELESLVKTVRVISDDIGMEFGTQKCAMLEMRRGRMIRNEVIDLPNGESIKALAYKYLGILECDTVKNVEMKELIRNEYLIQKDKKDSHVQIKCRKCH